MYASQQGLLQMLGEPNTKLAIPIFQRAYSWQTAQCDELIRDSLKASQEDRSHFVGAMLYFFEDGIRYLVDGQQRMVTMSLITLAIARRLEETGETLPGLDPAELRATYLHDGEARKLTLGIKDDATLQAVLDGTELPANPSKRITENLAFFTETFSAEGFDLVALWKGLNALSAIVVELDPDDSSQDIFESFNSKGVQLTTADLCRNYLLAGLPQEEQTRMYEEYWEPIENLFGDDPGSLKLNNAILGWLTIRFRRIRAKGDKQAFFVFKRYMQEEFDSSIEALLGEIMNFSKVWAENYRYHPVKNFKSTGNWATLGAKTLVSGRQLKPASKEALEFYAKHFGIVVG